MSAKKSKIENIGMPSASCPLKHTVQTARMTKIILFIAGINCPELFFGFFLLPLETAGVDRDDHKEHLPKLNYLK